MSDDEFITVFADREASDLVSDLNVHITDGNLHIYVEQPFVGATCILSPQYARALRDWLMEKFP